ncbi:hypothetical protein [Cryobacterium ruanii]|uniref:Polysaccharide chain length determinant N-terminal domain-containing protein n=1 Tax=Cryobacterium ruanii TaxID=1259197 RepID=A0A4R9ANZ1_9MICO|nr:hypothetical protein [Cryobacterium ruanii]TFD66792.1 hypothetical protein E3T47_06370 [Cryobacterium ruanii]
MTTRNLLQILARRWYVVMVVLIATGLLYATLARHGSYYSEVQVVFVAPGDVALAPFNDQRRVTLVSFASAIESEIHNGRPTNRLAEGAPLFGAGVDQGYQVLMPNRGGQWQYSFPDPVLTVRAVGPDPQWATATVDGLVTHITALVAQRQQSNGVPVVDTIHIEQVPNETTANYVGSSTDARARALVSLILVGLAVAAFLAVTIDRISQKVQPK